MSWWKTETNFNEWVGKLQKYPDYEKQAEELRADIRSLFTPEDLLQENDPRILDVGGGNGRMKLGKVIDISEGFDLTLDWGKQGLTGEFDVVFTSLVLIVLPCGPVDHILTQMKWHGTRYLYLYEQVYPGEECGHLLDVKYGPKFAHNWDEHIEKNKLKVEWRKKSEVKPDVWERILIKL